VFLGVIGGVALLRRDGTRPPVAATAATIAPVVPVTHVASPTPLPPAATTADPDAPPVVSPTDLPEATSPPTGHAAPPRRAAPASCNPPYTIGPNGYKKYKRECASL
jgi:hypothetical protein